MGQQTGSRTGQIVNATGLDFVLWVTKPVKGVSPTRLASEMCVNNNRPYSQAVEEVGV